MSEAGASAIVRPVKSTAAGLWSGRLRGAGKAVALGALLPVLVACAGLGTGLAAPKITVERISIGRVQATDAIVMMSLRMENPNDIDLALQSLRFALTIDDLALASGNMLRNETIAARGSAVIDLETRTNIVAVLRLIGLSTSGRTQALHYALDGEAIVQNGLRLPFARRGEIPLATPPTPIQPTPATRP